MNPEEAELLRRVYQVASQPFWARGDFLASFVIGLLGLLFSILAFVEAKGAKKAATAAGHTVKLQTITIELAEVCQRLDQLRPDVSYSEARDLLTEVSRRVHRLTAPFVKQSGLGDNIQNLRSALDIARDALASVRPTTQGEEVAGATYNAIEFPLGAIANLAADLAGLLENETIEPQGKKLKGAQ